MASFISAEMAKRVLTDILVEVQPKKTEHNTATQIWKLSKALTRKLMF